MIHKDKFSLCGNEECDYTLNLKMKNMKTMIIECQVTNRIEKLDYQHQGGYYEKKYLEKQKTTYELPFKDIVKDLDVTVTLTPVTGKTGLYIHPFTIPLELGQYQWQETGNLAKRITIRNSELQMMQITQPTFYITVFTEDPGEYMINVVAHESNLKGVLEHGVIEGGFVQAKEINNYIYLFEIFESRKISFSINMNVMSGDADLFMKQCSDSNCEITESNLNSSGTFKVQNEHEKKVISNDFECKHDPKFPSTICYFVIGVHGKENHGTHYDLTLHEDNQHRLITPGHLIKINLSPQEVQYFKFSYPYQKRDGKLIFSIEAVWGNFSIFISKKNEFPNATNSDVSRTFQSTKSGLYGSYQQIEMDDEDFKDRVEGVYYIAVESLTSCQVNIKFYELH